VGVSLYVDFGKRGDVGMDEAKVMRSAAETLVEVKFENTEDEIDVVAIAQKLGFVVGNAELNDDADGFVIVDEEKDEILGISTSRLIGVSMTKSLEQKRFIVAHEIGHYKLHYDRKADNGVYAHRKCRTGKDEREDEANFFAANLLMPGGRFTDKYKELEGKGLSTEEIVVLLAERFVVTRHTVKRRIKELSLLGDC
jgi:Zn-dependent peptidase ImmA (M78 family)